MSIIELVNSLYPAEKRHFTLYTGNHEKVNKPKYVQLYDFINSHPNTTIKELENAGFKAAEKNFLKEKIEQSLHDLNLGKTITSKLKWFTESMERYFKKQQWKELENCISKTKRLSKKHEQYIDWLQAIHWEKEMLVSRPEIKQRLEKFEKLTEEEQNVKGSLDAEINYFNLRVSLDTLLIKDLKLVNQENKKKFLQMIATKLLSENAKPISVKSKANYFHLKARTAYYKGEKEKSYLMAKKLVTVFENNNLFLNEYIDWYKNSICLLCGICIYSGQVDEIPQLIKKIGNDDAYFKIACLHGIRYSIAKLDKENGMVYLNRMKAIFENQDHQIRLGRQLAIFYNAAVFCSLFSDWVKMNYWIRRILHFKRTDDRRDIQFGARILSLLNHFELESDDMDNHIQAVAHYFKNNKQYNEINKYIVQVFRYLYRAVNRKEMLPIWKDLRDYLNPKVEERNKATQQLGLGELSIWCTSKIENISMAEVYKNS